MPKKASSAFQLFIGDLKHDKSFKEQLGANSRMFLQEASKKWNSLEPEHKQVYIDRSQLQKEQYIVWKDQQAAKK